ncbi:protein Mis18-beta [Anabas testudineus]|uniref:protein Mis18-beta n=1 Tax=Anabas testudineus TaxID=64144 RepID=UPI000E4560B5|nr:protein Mis18-beta [Anabas testudineus]
MEYDKSILIKRIDDLKVIEEPDKQQMTLHCAQCNRVLGDSVGVCGEIQSMDSIVCSRVTNDVVISDAMVTGHKGELANCIYSSLKCHGCRCAVGKLIHSAPSHLATIRSLFLLSKSNISCYILNSSSMVKASMLTFDLKPLSDSIDEWRQQCEVHLDQMSHIKSKLADRSITSELDK